NAPFGEKSKEWARRWVECESFGGVGLGLFDVSPIMESGCGSFLYDADGKEYLDFLSGFSVSALGNNNAEINAIFRKQLDHLTHFFDLPHVERIKLAEKLCRSSRMRGSTKVMFGVTGSDAIELAVRAARYFTGQPYILTAYGDYHGVTYGTMGLTSKGNMQPYFYPVRPNMDVGYFPFPHAYRSPNERYPGFDMGSLKLFEAMLDGKETPYTDGAYGKCNVAAILVEPFQSSAGYYIPPREYLQELRRIADRFGMLLIVDEIQAGLGRSGKLWAFEHSGIEPDMICTSKALGGGLPLSAVIARAEILEDWGPGAHVSTQAANVVACAAGNYIIDVVSSEPFLAGVRESGAYLLERMKDLQARHAIVGYLDNCGLYTGIELVKDRTTKEPASDAAVFVRDQSVKAGLLFEKGGYYHNRLQLIPPLNISRKELDRAAEILDHVFGAAEKEYGIG
ncbi:MAG TPA: aspartate aminotransferase family protein, partial [Bacteroidota bacterium]|nr:aspartate aminotransferase family protein [Bacteroidota bacterium]